MPNQDVQIPSEAVSEDEDVRVPVRNLLEDLQLLGGADDDAKGLDALLRGPPESIALIEAGITAASKWWAAGLGTALVALWAAVAGWWPTQEDPVQVAVVGGAAVVSAALVISIGYLIASDVRGRSSAATATIQARAQLATTMIQAAQYAWGHAAPAPSETAAAPEPSERASVPRLVPLSSGVPAKNHHVAGSDQDGWRAVAVERHPDKGIRYLLVKGTKQQFLGPDDIFLKA
jgi:hypothetical protein